MAMEQPPDETQEVVVIDDLGEPVKEREKKPSPGPSIDKVRVDIREEAKRFWS